MAVLERKIIHIDEDKCNGCGLCVDACHEGAIRMVDGKARLVSDMYCDGLGDCLGPCPTGALSIVTRPADAYDEEAVKRRQAETNRPVGGGCPGSAARSLKPAPAEGKGEALPCGCPGSMSKTLKEKSGCCESASKSEEEPDHGCCGKSELVNWPVQLKLVPPGAPYLAGADILLAADCAAVASPDFHRRFLKNRPVIIACPKLDENDWQIDKLRLIVEAAKPSSITVLRMEVPCCGGLTSVAEEAVRRSGLNVPIEVVILGIDGK